MGNHTSFVILLTSIYGYSKEKLFETLTSSDLLNDQLDVFYKEDSTPEEIQRAGIEIFLYIYKSHRTTLSKIRLHRDNKQAKIGIIRLESLLPKDSATAKRLVGS